MSLADYREFVYGAGMLNEADPGGILEGSGQEQQKLVDGSKVATRSDLKGSQCGSENVHQRSCLHSLRWAGNFPDGEIYTGPVEDSVEGRVRFNYPAIEYGQEVTDIELWFEKGRVVKEIRHKESGTSDRPAQYGCRRRDPG